MGRNVFECAGRRFGDLCCVHLEVQRDKEGNITSESCPFGGHDDYNLFPEHDPSDGRIVYNSTGGNDPIKVGPNVIWESASPHEHGLSYSSWRDMRIFAEIHPEYHLIPVNHPVRSGTLGDDQVGEIFGFSNPTLVCPAWNDVYIRGIPRVQKCTKAIYGKEDKFLSQSIKDKSSITNKAFKNYLGVIKGWKNYTNLNLPIHERFSVVDEPIEIVTEFCLREFGDNVITKRLVQAVEEIRKGHFIDITQLLMANGIDMKRASNFSKEISVKGKSSLYGKNINIENYASLLYMAKSDERLANLVNFLLNYPSLNMHPSQKEFYSTSERFWYLKPVLTEAYNRNINKTGNRNLRLLNLEALEPNMIDQLQYLKHGRNEIFVFGDNMVLDSTLSHDILSDINEVQYFSRKDTTDWLYPAMNPVDKLIELDRKKKGQAERFETFTWILRAGQKWSPTEIRNTWYFFNKACDAKKPSMFWKHIETIVESDVHVVDSLLEVDGEFSQGRWFARNLLDAKIKSSTFDVTDPKPNLRWETTSGHADLGGTWEDGSHDQNSRYNVSWRKLAMIGLKRDKNKVEELFKDISKEDMILHDLSLTEAGIDEEDLDFLSVIDPSRDDLTIYNEED